MTKEIGLLETNDHSLAQKFGSIEKVAPAPPRFAGKWQKEIEMLDLQKDQKKVYISTYGCQMNVHDTERMYSLLEMINYVPAVSPDQAGLIIINSCSVREKPVHKVRSEAGRYHLLKQKIQL